MSNYDETNRGAIWKNDKREKDTHPHFRGSLNVEGVEYWVSAWKRDPDGNPNAPALKFTLTAKEEAHNQGMRQAQQASQPRTQAVPEQLEDDDLPF